MTNDHVRLTAEYSKDKIMNYIYLLVFGAIVIVLILLLGVYMIASKPKPKYFVTDEREQIFESQTLTTPIYNNAQIKDWTAQNLIRLFNINFINYKARIERNAILFTPSGYSSYVTLLNQTDLPTIVNGEFVAKASLCDVVALDKKATGIYNVEGKDTYVWTLIVPLYLEYRNKSTYNVIARALVQIQRVSEFDYLGGLAISDIQILDRVKAGDFSAGNLPVCNS